MSDRLGNRRIDIFMQCPGCASEYGQAAREYWRHGDRCRGVLQLDEYANVICSRCGAHAHLTKMQLSCSSGRHVVYTPETDAYILSISCSSAFVNGMGQAWLMRVLEYLCA